MNECLGGKMSESYTKCVKLDRSKTDLCMYI